MSLPATKPPTASGSPAVVVRPAEPADLTSTAQVHRRSLPGGFFARLGTRFLARYHATFAAGPRATLLVAEDEGRIVGFLAGTVDNAQHYRDVVRRWPLGLTASGVAALLRRPRLAVEFVRTRAGRYGRALRRYARRRAEAPPSPRDDGASGSGGRPSQGEPVVAVLTHVAVAEDARGLGAGRELVAAFTRRARAAGVDELRLVTASRAAGRFYRRLGWVSRGERRASDGTVVEEFVRRP